MCRQLVGTEDYVFSLIAASRAGGWLDGLIKEICDTHSQIISRQRPVMTLK